MNRPISFDGKLYRKCNRHTSETSGHYIGRTLGFASLVCHNCHHIYHMDSHGNEVDVHAAAKEMDDNK